MNRTPLVLLGSALLAGALLAAGSAPAAPDAAPQIPTAKQPAVDLILHRCGGAKCHGGAKPKEHLDMSTLAGISAAVGVEASQTKMKLIAPGDPETSYLFLKITKKRRPTDTRIKWKSMPPGNAKLDDGEIALIEAWIKTGAKVE